MCPGNKLWEQSVNDRVKKLMMTSNIQGAIGVQCRVDVNRGLHAVKSSPNHCYGNQTIILGRSIIMVHLKNMIVLSTSYRPQNVLKV